jgi:hypothetical protein
MAAVVKRTEGPFGKRGVDEGKFSVGTAPGNCAEGEAIVDDDDDDWVCTDQGMEEVKLRARWVTLAECEIVQSYDIRPSQINLAGP